MDLNYIFTNNAAFYSEINPFTHSYLALRQEIVLGKFLSCQQRSVV